MQLKKRNKRQKESGSKKGAWPITYKLVAMGTLVAYTAIGSQKIAIASAQEQRGDSSQSKESQDQTALPTRRFDIAPGPLGDILGDFEKESGLHVLVPNEKIRNISSPGVSGVFTNEQALNRLLMGTGINYRFIGADSVRLTLAPFGAIGDGGSGVQQHRRNRRSILPKRLAWSRSR
jgi:hypothetical protein